MNTKPIIITIQCVTLFIIFIMMAKSGISKYNVAGAIVMIIAIALNVVVEIMRYKSKKKRP